MPNMDTSATPPSSAPSETTSSGPAAKDLLRAIAVVAPQIWFPSKYAELSGFPRDHLDEPLWLLRQAGMIHVADWIAGLGQGFQLTHEGQLAADQAEPLVLASVAPHSSTVSDSDSTDQPQPIPPPAILAPALLVANLLVFAVGLFLAWKAGVGVEFLKGEGHPASNQTLMQIGALTGSKLLLGEWWRLLSCCFVHIGLFHLFGNLLMLGILGPVSEGLWGRRRFVLIYLVSGIAGSCVAMALHPMTETVEAGVSRPVLLAGASGALWGILLSVVIWAVLFNLVLSFAPGISVEAHFGGGLAGVILAFWFDRGWRPNRILSLLGVALLIAVLVGALYGFMRYSDDWRQLRQGMAEPFKTPHDR
jgi:rhomboid protease GluP